MSIIDALEQSATLTRPSHEGQRDGRHVDPKIDRYVLALIDGGLDLVLSADGPALVEQARRVKVVHDRMVPDVAEVTVDPLYIAGRIGALTDMLGLAADRCAPSRFEQVLRQERLVPLLRALFVDGAIRNLDLVERLGESRESVCRKLRELKDVGAVTASKHGREVVNVLLPAARAFLAAEWGGEVVDESTFDLDVFQGLAPDWAIGWTAGFVDEAGLVTVPRLALAEQESADEAEPYAEAA